MTYKKRKKNKRLRGSKTHGWGSMKKHRGTGNRGGKGRAGSGKRADSKKASININEYFGKEGFIKKNPRIIKAVNIEWIDQKLNMLLAGKLAEEKGGVYHIDLRKLGFDKLLGTGRVTKKFRINADYASSKVVEKIKNAGGEVILPEVKAPEEKEKKEEE